MSTINEIIFEALIQNGLFEITHKPPQKKTIGKRLFVLNPKFAFFVGCFFLMFRYYRKNINFFRQYLIMLKQKYQPIYYKIVHQPLLQLVDFVGFDSSFFSS